MITIEQARAYYPEEDAAHDFDHVLRVLNLAERIGVAEGADMEVLRAAVLLHDVARLDEERSGCCHAEAGAARARAILAGQPPDKVEAVARAIATHRFRKSGQPESLEARILYDADKLDAIGAIGVARAYAIAGRCGQRLWASVPPDYAQRRVLDGRRDLANSEHTPVHEFVFKLSRLQRTLFTATAQAIASERHAYMLQFFQRLDQEVAGRL